ncbi:MAG TPA: WG repeat-containing protein [Terriglobales bacterium]|nr:WG repeat-containing protein [Terriglobales bacterium]
MRDGQGKLFIAQEYVSELEFDSHGLAQVFRNGGEPRHGWMYVDRKGRVIVQGVPIIDNWADEFSEGLVRTVINEKYGFADRQGRIVVAPRYDWAAPFEKGHAEVCIGCREVCVKPDNMGADSDGDCEHHTVTGGEWFKINKLGRVVARVRR